MGTQFLFNTAMQEEKGKTIRINFVEKPKIRGIPWETYEFSVSTPRCVYVISELIWSNSRFSRHTRPLAIAKSAFSNSGSCRVLMELLDEHTVKREEREISEIRWHNFNRWGYTYGYFDWLLMHSMLMHCIHLRQAAAAVASRRRFPSSRPAHLGPMSDIRVACAPEYFSILGVDLPIVLILRDGGREEIVGEISDKFRKNHRLNAGE